MPDREKVIKALEFCADQRVVDTCYGECPYAVADDEYKCLQMKLDALALLKEQEAVKPVLDEQTGRIWLCGKCGTYVGFEDNDPHDPNEFDKYCRECGRSVLWEGR